MAVERHAGSLSAFGGRTPWRSTHGVEAMSVITRTVAALLTVFPERCPPCDVLGSRHLPGWPVAIDPGLLNRQIPRKACRSGGQAAMAESHRRRIPALRAPSMGAALTLAGQACVVVGAAALFVMALERTSWAWNFPEHEELGREAYLEACGLLKGLPADQDQARRLALACPAELSSGPPKPKGSGERSGALRAQLYGQACAISGDLVAKPEDLTSSLGGAQATDDIHYYSLALINSDHFQPQSVQVWRHWHTIAVEAAMTNSSSPVQEAETFDQMFYRSAFADHFLQDSFAAGHMGFNRAASSAGSSKSFHDYWNNVGRWVRSGDGATWMTWGDGHLNQTEVQEECSSCLCEPRAPREIPHGCMTPERLTEAKRHVGDAERASILAVLRAFVFKQVLATDEVSVLDAIPRECQIESHEFKLMDDHGVDDDKKRWHGALSCCQLREEVAFEPIEYIRTPAASWRTGLSLVSEAPLAERQTQLATFDERLTLGSGLPVLHTLYMTGNVGGSFGHADAFVLGYGIASDLFTTANGFVSVDLEIGGYWLALKQVSPYARAVGDFEFGLFYLRTGVGISWLLGEGDGWSSTPALMLTFGMGVIVPSGGGARLSK